MSRHGHLLGDVCVCHQATSSGGATVATKVYTEDVLLHKTVGVYFSASSFSPSNPTQSLAKAFSRIKKTRDDFEIVFVSGDRDRAALYSYFSEMPWLALPFSQAMNIGPVLRRKFSVSDPAANKLVLLDSQGRLITGDGLATVLGDPTGSSWLPAAPVPKATLPLSSSAANIKGLQTLLGPEPLLGKQGKIALPSVVGGAPLVAFYVGARRSAPCRAATPKLARFQKELHRHGYELPVVFCSDDSDEGTFRAHFASMPWHALPYKDWRTRALCERFGVDSVPWLLVLDTQGNLIANDVEVPRDAKIYREWCQVAAALREGSTRNLVAPAA